MKTLKSMIFCLIVILGVSSFAKAAPLSLESSTILYVKQGGTSADFCTSWATACDLQTALSNVSSGDQVWVAMGTYKPTTTDLFDRIATFQLKTGVAIYGGFPAAGGTLEQRDWVAHPTTLSGDIGIADNITDNSYRVVTGISVDATAVLDGFTISGGNANVDYPYDHGGGMYNEFNSSPKLTNVTFSRNSATYGGGMFNESSSSPTLTNVTFTKNSADWSGGMYNDSSSPTLNGVTFTGNSADYGGGMVNWSSDPELTNVTFSTNSASGNGGGMYNIGSSPELTNVTFTENQATLGGGMYNSSSSNLTLTNAIVWGNTPDQIYNSSSTPIITFSNIQDGGYPEASNIITDPLLCPLANNGGFTQTHALGASSPAIDAGDPNNCPSTDQRGFPRPIDGNRDGTATCDMGAYEYDPINHVFLPLIVK